MQGKTLKTALPIALAILALAPALLADEEMDGPVRDHTPPGVVRQPSFVADGGTLNKNEHAFLLYANGDVLPPAVMFGYRYGLYYWWEIGLDVGGDWGVFQALIHTKAENFKTVETEIFYWGMRFNSGYKQHEADLGDGWFFDDRSWVYELTNTFALRFGPRKDKALYLNTSFYIDQDLHEPRRQTDYYLRPAVLGFETVFGKYFNFFFEAGVVWSINGMETNRGVLYENGWFPVARLGFAVRTDDRTAIYYTRETRHESRVFR